MSGALHEAVLLGQQQHEPPAGAHIVLLAGIALAALAIFGVSRWRRRRDAAAAHDHVRPHARSGESTRSTEDE